MKKEIHALKCIKCPYRLGMVENGLTPPCAECMNSKRVTPPFPDKPPAK